ncbi:MFS transporter [Chryseolinea sp. T2]|uniref:MFS transporter n=1 Tax=Chryseolinea sp. T2 TaxID=3129255 RepID=UPI00307797B7
MSSKDQKIYTPQFWLLCASALLFFASFNMLLPELSGFLERLGGGGYKGLIIALFTLTAMISRPFSGKLADKVGRVPVIMVGSIVCFLCSLVYPLLATVAGFMLLRLVHGFSTGFTPTGTAAYMSDVIPANRRGEAMGMLGTFGSLGMAAGPALGGMLANRISLNAVFYCASAFGLVSIVILLGIRETLKERQSFRFSMLKVKKEDLFDPRVLAPCIVMVCLGFSYGTVFTLIPDFGESVLIRNKGLLFTYMTMAALVVRLIGGRASDRWGRKPVLRVCSLFIAVAMTTIAFADSPLQLIIGMTIYGLAHGTTSPTLIAWATDLSDPLHKGRGVASVYIFMELGIGVGALASGLIYSNDTSRFPYAFALCASLAIIAFSYLILARKRVVAS